MKQLNSQGNRFTTMWTMDELRAQEGSTLDLGLLPAPFDENPTVDFLDIVDSGNNYKTKYHPPTQN